MPNFILKDINGKEYNFETYYSANVNTMEKLNPSIYISEHILDKTENNLSENDFNNKEDAIKYSVQEIIDIYDKKYEANMKTLDNFRSKIFILRNKIINNREKLERISNYISNTKKYKEISDFYNEVLKGNKIPEIRFKPIDSDLSNKIGEIPIGQKLYQLDYRSLTSDKTSLVSTAIISGFNIRYQSLYLDVTVENGYFPFKNIIIKIEDIENSKIDITKGISNYTSIKYFTEKEDVLNELERAKESLAISSNSFKF